MVSGEIGSYSEYLNLLKPGYWGNSCQMLSSNIFAFLNAQGISADIVIGTVVVNGKDPFLTTLEVLKEEYLSPVQLEGDQRLHAWVTLGDDTIIDAGLPSRLVARHNYPEWVGSMMFTERANTLFTRYYLRYHPLIVGTDFFAKTNPPDPEETLAHMQSGRLFA